MAEQMDYPNAGRIHVLRHNFEPSEPLAQLIQDFTGPSLRPRFLLRSSKSVYVDSVLYNRGAYREEDEEVKETIIQSKRHPIYIARAAFKLAQAPSPAMPGQKTVLIGYRLNLLPFESEAFEALNDSLDVYPEAQPARGPSRHYLYLDLPPQAAFTMRDREEAEDTFRRTVAQNAHRRLYCATVSGVRAIEVPMMPRQPASSEQTA